MFFTFCFDLDFIFTFSHCTAKLPEETDFSSLQVKFHARKLGSLLPPSQSQKER